MSDDHRRKFNGRLIGIAVLCIGVISVAAFLFLQFMTPLTDPAMATFRADGKVTAVVFSPDSKYLATLEADTNIRLRQVSDGQIAATLVGHTSPVQSIAMSPTARLLASGSRDGTVRLWEYPSGRLVASLPIPVRDVPCLVFSPDGQFLAAAIGNRFEEHAHGYIQLWRVSDQTASGTIADQEPAIDRFAFSPEGTLLITSNIDQFGIWRIQDGKLARAWKSNSRVFFGLLVSSSEPIIVTDSGSTIDLWQRADGHYLGELGEQPGQLWSLAMSTDGQLVASASGSPGYREGNPTPDRSIRIWRIADRSLIKTIEAHPAAIHALAFNMAGTLLASGSDDKTIKLWKLK